ncbi:ankyrin, partial [Coprinopsis marcescibilis]
LCEAVRCGQKETVELLLSQEGVDVNQRDRGDTALIRACIKGYPGIVEVLLAQPEIQVNKQDERGSTALHHVANGKHETILAMLLARTDLDVNIDNDHGNTPLTLASYRGHTNIVRGLLARSDILVNKPEPKRQETALHMAASRGDLECVALLAGAAGVDINARDIRGYTPYHVAMSAGQNMVVEFLSELPGIDL